MNRMLRSALVLATGVGILALASCSKEVPATEGAGTAGSEKPAAATAAPATGAPAAAATPDKGAAADPTPAAPTVAAKRPEGTKTAYDLLANRYLAHLHLDGGIYLPCGDAGFLKYIQGTWKSSWTPLREVDGERVALTKGIQGSVRFPFDAAVCADGCDVRFDMKPLVAGQRVSVFLNEKEYTALETPRGFETYTIKLRPADFVTGENRLRFHFRSAGDYKGEKTAAAFRSIAIVPTGSTKAPKTAPAWVAPITVGGQKRAALAASPFERIDWILALPAQAKLLVATGLASGNGAFAVDVTDARTNETKRVATIPAAAGAWQEQIVDLGAYADKLVRLTLVAEVEGGAEGGWADPIIAIPDAPIAKAAPAKNVIVWIADTMRWDRIKAYKPDTRVKTPNFDAFIAKGTLFESFVAPGPHSIPSHSTFLTSLYPEAHGHREDTTSLKPEHTLLGEVLKKNGIATAMVSSNGYVSTKWGFDQGWDYYKNFIRDGEPAAAKFLYDEAVQWLKDNKDKRFFLHLITIDMHVAYRWRDDYCKQYDPEPYNGPVKPMVSGNFLNKIQKKQITLSERDKQRMETTYDCNATYNDDYFGRLLKTLDELGIRQDTAIIVVSDHGDEFFEHGSVGHGATLYNEAVHVPFFLGLPGNVPEGKRIAVSVEGVDLAPTILDLFGLDAKTLPAAQGESLLPLVYGEGPQTPRAAFSDLGQNARSMQVGTWKYILRQGDAAALYDTATDPYEKEDVRAKYPIADRYCRDVLAFWTSYDEKWSKRTWGLPNNHGPAFVEEAAR